MCLNIGGMRASTKPGTWNIPEHPGTFRNISEQGKLSQIIIQQIVTMPIYGKEALNICHPYMTDILRYT